MKRYLLAAAALALTTQFAQASPLASSTLSPGNGIAGIEVTPIHNDCHRSIRTHGGSYRRHYHDPDDCDVIYEDDDDDDVDYDDCHHSVLRHYLPSYGKVWHRHRGSSCNIEIYEYESGPTPGYGNCIQIGPATLCH